MVSGHYRMELNFTLSSLDDAARSVERLLEFRRRLEAAGVEAGATTGESELPRLAERALGDFDPGSRPWLEEVYATGDDPGRQAVIYAVRLDAAALSPSSIPSP